MIRLYNVLRKFSYLSDVKDAELIDTPENQEENVGLNKALDSYRKLIEKKADAEPLTEKELENLEKRLLEIQNREVVEKNRRT